MRLEAVSLKNMAKHSGRVAFLVIGLIVTVATIIALYTLSGMMNEDFQNRLDEYGSNMIIVPKANDLSLSYGGVSMGSAGLAETSLRDEDVPALKTIKNSENLAVISPKIVGPATLNGQDVIVVGVNFPDELRIKKWWEVREGAEPKGRGNEVLAGSETATRLGLRPGQKIKLLGETFRISGILEEVGSQEDRPLYMDLKTAQRLFDRKGQLDLIEVSAWCYDCPIETIVGQTSEKLPHAQVSSVVQAAKTREKVVAQFNRLALMLSAAVILVGGLIIFSSMLAAVRERRREIGIFRAVGFRGVNILEIILFETVMLALVGGVLGYLVGLAATALAAPALGLSVPVEINLTVGYFAVLGTMVLTLVSSLYPALQAAKLSPMIALNDF